MSIDDDYRYALELQKNFNAELDSVDLSALDHTDEDDDASDFKMTIWKEADKKTFSKNTPTIKRSNPRSNLDPEFLNRTQNLVHPQWETLDPTPDVFALFGQFDSKFFQNRLKCVTLEWSKRMYSCAGICYSRKNRFGMAITIRLSEPLLKLRPRKDLVETMLHEMIHAYCFVLNIREGNGGHGPNFKKIMHAINKVAGTNITVYHTFHDEVDLYKQHWWRCNGVCQDRSPFFGFVKRTSNRAPGPNDIWWSKHQQDCGGTFMKIKEPEKAKKGINKQTKKIITAQNSEGGLHKYFTPVTGTNVSAGKAQNSNINSLNDLNKKKPGGFMKINGGSGTMLLNPKTSGTTSSVAKAFPPSSYPGTSSDPFKTTSISGGNLRNVRTFSEMSNDNNRSTQTMANWGKGNSLSEDSSTKTKTESVLNSGKQSEDGTVNRQHLRDLWSKRFDKKDDEKEKSESNKKRRISNEGNEISNMNSPDLSKWIVVDDDIMLQECENKVISVSSEEEDDFNRMVTTSSINKNMTMDERQAVIKKEILNESVDLCDEDIELIDDEYDDKIANDSNLLAATELANTSVIDEFFGDDTLLKDYLVENDIRLPGSSRQLGADFDIITCPICQGKMQRKVFAEHLNGCTGIAVKIKPPTHTLKKLAAISKEARPKQRLQRSKKDAKDILRKAGYTESDLIELAELSSFDESEESSVNIENNSRVENISNVSTICINSSPENENLKHNRQRNLYKTTRQCPACGQEIEENEMNHHIEECVFTDN